MPIQNNVPLLAHLLLCTHSFWNESEMWIQDSKITSAAQQDCPQQPWLQSSCHVSVMITPAEAGPPNSDPYVSQRTHTRQHHSLRLCTVAAGAAGTPCLELAKASAGLQSATQKTRQCPMAGPGLRLGPAAFKINQISKSVSISMPVTSGSAWGPATACSSLKQLPPMSLACPLSLNHDLSVCFTFLIQDFFLVSQRQE